MKLPHLLAAALLGAAVLLPAGAETPAYPSKPIRMVVPFAAGGPADAMARLLANKLTQSLGQPMIVDNRGGAAGILGWDNVAKSPADGYTVLFSGPATFAILPILAKLPYDPEKDITGVSSIAKSPNVFVTSAAAGLHTLAAVVAKAKADPGRMNLGLAAPGTITHFAGTLLQRDAGIRMTEVPYKGGAPAVNALLAGDIDFLAADVVAVLPFIEAGKLTAVAVTGPGRIPALPNVPTTAELGYPGVLAVNEFGLYAPAATPRTVVDKLSAAVTAALKLPDVQDTMNRQGVAMAGSTPTAFEAANRDAVVRWGPLARASGLRLN